MDSKLARARQVLAVAESRLGIVSANRQADFSDAYSVPSFWEAVLPHGLLRRGVLSVEGSFSGGIALAGCASQAGAWVISIGRDGDDPSFLLDSGIDLERFAYVDAREDVSVRVVSVATSGFGVVMLGDMPLSDRERSVLLSQALAHDCLIIAPHWKRASAGVQCRLLGVSGISGGEGHISHVNYEMSSRYGSARMSFTRTGWEGAATQAQLRLVEVA